MDKYKQIIKFLQNKGIQAWVSGGTARDIWLGLEPSGNDISVNCSLSDLSKVLKDYYLDSDTYNTTYTIIYLNNKFTLYPLKKIELINTYYNFEFTNSLKEDSATKDFTINGLYYNPLEDKWIDHVGGIKDLRAKVIRLIDVQSPAEVRLLESKIRIIRAPILNSILGAGWQIDENTTKAIKKYKLRIIATNTRQIQPEITKLLLRSKKPSTFFKYLKDIDLLRDFFPELYHTINISQSNKAENLDLFQHTMLTLDAMTKRHGSTLELRLAALLHDIGKPYTQYKSEKTGLHFYNHDNVGAHIAAKILQRWGYPKHVVDKVVLLVDNHLFDASPKKTLASVKKLILRVGTEHIYDLLELRIADRLGTGRLNISMSNISKLKDKVDSVLAKIDPTHLKLAISDQYILKHLNQPFDFTVTSLFYVQQYLREKVISGNILNKPESLKKSFRRVNEIECPLGTEHVFKTWTKLHKKSADIYPNGKLKCGVFCNFLCNEKHMRLK